MHVYDQYTLGYLLTALLSNAEQRHDMHIDDAWNSTQREWRQRQQTETLGTERDWTGRDWTGRGWNGRDQTRH